MPVPARGCERVPPGIYGRKMDDTYTADLIGSSGTDTVELEFINGKPQKSFVRPAEEDGREVVWELIDDAEGYQYREAGVPTEDYA